MTTHKALHDLIGEMLRFVDPVTSRIEGNANGFEVTMGDVTIKFVESAGPIDEQLERLATMIERSIAYTRARAMLAAAGAAQGALPLWLVTGSSVLASWLNWSRTDTVFQRRLEFTDGPDAPIIGTLDRRARQNLGQVGVKIRVRHGLAVAERIELPGRVRCIAALGKEATIRIEGNPLAHDEACALKICDNAKCVDKGMMELRHSLHVAQIGPQA